MRKAITGVVILILALPAMGGYMGQVRTGQSYGPYQTGAGGEFTLWRVSGWVGLTGLPGDITGTQNGVNYDDSFQTFCVELNEYIHTNTTYNVNISYKTIQGGRSLTDKVAFLYQNFRLRTLTGYNYDGTAAQRKVDADLLQQAIWHFMGLPGYENVNNKFTQLANATVGTSAWETGYLGSVAILNMYNGYDQDQLTIVPAPAAGLLGVIGLGLVGWVKRRLA